MNNSWKKEIRFFQSLNHVNFYLKLPFLIKSGYYIVPSPSTALEWVLVAVDSYTESSSYKISAKTSKLKENIIGSKNFFISRSLQNPTMASITTTTASQFYKQVTITPPNVQKPISQGVTGGTTTMRIGGTLPGMYPTFPNKHTGTVAPSKLSSRDRPRFFDQVGHQTTNASIGNK